MIRFHRSCLACLIVATVLLLATWLGADRLTFAQEGPSATPNVNWVSAAQGINVRGGPGFTYNVIGLLSVGSWVQPLGRSSDGGWILIVYYSTQGWVQKDGVSWRLNTNALPVIQTADATPIPAPLYYTPGGPTYTPNANWVNVGVEGGFVRSGPGQGYLVIGELFTGDVVDPVAHDRAEDWVLIRFGDGYGWMRYDLVAWITDIALLPMVDVPNLTPSFTATSPIPSATHTYTPTHTPTHTAMPTPTATPSPTPTASVTPSPEPSVTPTDTTTPTATWTETLTPSPSSTASVTPSPTTTLTPTPMGTDTPIPTDRLPDTPTQTPSLTAIAPATETVTPSPTITPSITWTSSPAPTDTLSPTSTVAAVAMIITDTPSATATVPSPTESPTPQVVAASGSASGEGEPVEPPGTAALRPLAPSDQSEQKNRTPLLLLGGLALIAAVYVSAYVVQLATLDHYRDGFVLSFCPVCEEGVLSLDERRYRVLGIPRVRRVVRCDVCRSVLRQVGRRRWRYAVDGAANAGLYDALNGRVVTEARLLEIAPEHWEAPPQFIEDDDIM